MLARRIHRVFGYRGGGSREGGENSSGVEPAGTVFRAENKLPIEIAALDLTDRGMPAVRAADRPADAESAFGKIQPVAHGAAYAVVRRPLEQRRVDAALQDKVLRQPAYRIFRQNRGDAGAQAEAAAQPSSYVVFPSAFPDLKLACSVDAAFTGVEPEHDFTKAQAIPSAGGFRNRQSIHGRSYFSAWRQIEACFVPGWLPARKWLSSITADCARDVALGAFAELEVNSLVPRAAGITVIVITSLLVLRVCTAQSPGRTKGPATGAGDASKNLFEAFQAEEKLGTYVFYRQSYVDKENQRASYGGSIYGTIEAFHIDGCQLKLDITLQDYFSGTVGKIETGRLLDNYLYSISFTLTREIASTARVTEARPIQLSDNTNSTCSEKPSCDFIWLAVRAKKPVIQESRTIGGIRDFDGWTDHFQAPLSSAQAGKELIQDMQTLANTECR